MEDVSMSALQEHLLIRAPVIKDTKYPIWIQLIVMVGYENVSGTLTG